MGKCGVCGVDRKVVRVACGTCDKAVCWDTCCRTEQTPVGKNIEFTYHCTGCPPKRKIL